MGQGTTREYPDGTVLYLNVGDHELEHPRKLAGMVRFARAFGWRVEAYRRRDVPPSEIPALLRLHRPVGCIVEDSDTHQKLTPSIFRGVPLVYLDPSDTTCRAGRPIVVCDQRAVAAAAFRELSSGGPPAFAAVPSPSFSKWNVPRIGEFVRLCKEAGKPCRVFDGVPDEDTELRARRLGEFLTSLPRHTAIFAANDVTAKGVAEAADALGLRFPVDFTLVGVDATAETVRDSVHPGVSSIELDSELAGNLAAKLLRRLIEGDEEIPEPSRFGPLLVVRRESTRGRWRREPYIIKAVEIVRREACDGLTAAALAARFPGSRKHFERRFRETTGHGVLDEILHVRLQTAMDMLSRPYPPVSSIADFCGFRTVRELQKLFRSRLGCSPRQWRAQHLR